MVVEYRPTNSKTKKRVFRNFYDLSDEEKRLITSDKRYRPPAKPYKKKSPIKTTKLSEKRQKEKDKWRKLGKTNKVWYAYLLELRDGQYYIGITGNVAKRYERHCSGKGSLWTAKYRPVRILEERCLGRMTMDEAAMLEDEMFDEYFPVYGYRLRGGGKCKVQADW